MISGKRVALAIAAVMIALPLLVWVLGPAIVIHIAKLASSYLSECGASGTQEQCSSVFVRLGQTGDLFGALSSVFSGIALLSVAITIWYDAASRRTSRKPVVVCQVDDGEGILFDDVSTSAPRAVRLTLNLKVSAINDVAMNASLSAKIVADPDAIELPQFSIEMPLVSNGPAQPAKITVRFDDVSIAKFTSWLARDKILHLYIVATSESLEGASWDTAVRYELSFRESDFDKMLSLAKNDDSCATLWDKQALVLPDYRVAPGSWSHKSR